MNLKRFWAVLLICILSLGCTAVPVNAIDTTDDNTPILRVSNRLNQTISANSIFTTSSSFSLDKDETVSFNCTYTPKSASVDFGIIDSNDVFHYLNCTNGSINKSIKIDTAGQYTLAIRNNESYAVTVTGTVKY